MKVLVVPAPLLGHVLPLVPLATALREAGHEVLVAGRGEVAVVELARRWRPDLVVHEPLAPAGAVAAAVLGVPAVLQENSLADGPRLLAAGVASSAVRSSLRHHGLDELPAPALVLTVAPPSVVGLRAGLVVRAVPAGGGGGVPDWLRRPCYRPRIVVCPPAGAGSGARGDAGRAVAALAAALDAEVVLVRPRGRSAHRAMPGNVRRTGWVPLEQVLPHATAFVHHGDAGGVLLGLAVGVPQLVVSDDADRRSTAQLVAARGAGLAVPARAITAELLSHLVGDPGLRCSAHEVQREIAGMPAPSEVVPALVTVVGRRLRT